ncbi:serine/threonine-protein kinase [Haliangium sp.]|uniref:serine/threonine-protein kinase n=1 Tax=Haliangium sp. TaxID=2663208 RepID=UPI003D1163D1
MSASTRTDDLAGVTIADRYVIEECIGQGGMGRVYRARHTRVSRRFAVKVLWDRVATDDKARARFAHEAEAASRIAHPNLVSVIDFGEWQERLFLVMDFVEGRSLSEIIHSEAPLAAERVVVLSRQLAAGLHHAHERGLVHRDFKPGNVIVVREDLGELPRIVDFGLAMLPDVVDHQRLTTDGLVLGTPAFMSPEQACGEPVDHRSDLFAFGLIMYEMLAGKHPFDGSPAAIARQNLAVKPPRIGKRAPGVEVPSALEAIVFRLMAKDPGDRYSSGAAVVEALDSLPFGHTGPLRRVSSQSETPLERPRRRLRTLIGGAALVVVCAGIGALGWRLVTRTDPAGPAADQTAAGASARADQVLARAPSAAGAAPAAAPADAGVAVADPMADTDTDDAAAGTATAAAESVIDAGVGADPAVARTPDGKRVRRPARPRRRARPAPAPLTAEAFSRRYRAVGALVNRLERERGGDVAKPYRDRYLAIPMLDAVRVESIREESYAKLAKLAKAVRRALAR